MGPECGVDLDVALVETELLTREKNLLGLMAMNRDVIGQAEMWDQSDCTVLDMDSSESPVHGQQEGSAVAEIVEQKQRMVADRLEVPVVGGSDTHVTTGSYWRGVT